MKVRQGFVSNSSSSSYVLIVPEEECQKLEEEMSPLVKGMFNQLGGWKAEQFGNTPVKVLSWWQGNISSFEYMEHNPEYCHQYAIEMIKREGEDVNDADLVKEYESMAEYECWAEFTAKASKVGLLIRNHDS